MPQQGGGTRNKFLLSFSNLEKPLILNVTNKNVLVDRLGRNPADWIGADIGVKTGPVSFQGKTVQGFQLVVLNEPPKAAPAPALSRHPHLSRHRRLLPSITPTSTTIWAI